VVLQNKNGAARAPFSQKHSAILLDLGFTEFDVLARDRVVLLLDDGSYFFLTSLSVTSAAAENVMAERSPIFRAASCCKKWQEANSAAASCTETYDDSAGYVNAVDGTKFG
jgi:hypothetical protein